MVIIAAYVLLILLWCWPDDFDRTPRVYVAICWILFLCRTFLFHGGLVMLVLTAGVALAKQWRMATAAGVACLLMIAPEIHTMWPDDATSATHDTPSLKVVSVNLLMMNQNTAGIVDEIRAADADIVLLQEYTNHWHEALQHGIGPSYPHVVYRCREDSFGVAVYSKVPFVGEPDLAIPLGSGSVPQVRAVIRWADRDVAVYNVHLLPPWGLEYTTETRLQFADLARMLDQEKLPIIMAGDFNFTHSCTQADRLAELGFRDTHQLAGKGRGTTWPNLSSLKLFPGLMLDHVFLSPELCASTHDIGIGEGSDHRPITATVGFCND